MYENRDQASLLLNPVENNSEATNGVIVHEIDHVGTIPCNYITPNCDIKSFLRDNSADRLNNF